MKPYIALAVLAAIPLVPGVTGAVFAQTTTPVPPPAKKPKPAPRRAPSLDILRHNPETQGVLLFIGRGNDVGSLMELQPVAPKKPGAPGNADAPEEPNVPRLTPAQFAADINRRVTVSGNATAIVPLTMTVLTKNPPPADPYADMAFDERFMLMLGKFTRAQWAQAASENGIGTSDMTPEQREIYVGLWGEEGARVNTYRTMPRKEGQKYRQTVESKEEKFRGGDVRFRFSRRVSLYFEDANKGRQYGGGSLSYEKPVTPEPDGSIIRQYFSQPGGYSGYDESGNTKAFGVSLVRIVPNTLKPGDLGLDSPALNVAVMLDGSQKNVGDLLAAASKATRVELRADRRLMSVPVLMKVTPGGQAVKAGDLLKLICRSVTATFRHLPGANASDRGVYLLTDDREGLGTRLAQLEEWAKDAYEKRLKIISDATDACAENEPLDVLGFAPGYKYALSPELLKAGDEERRKAGGYYSEGVKVSPAKLSPELREQMTEQIKGLSEYGSNASVRTDQVGIKTDFHCDWVLPGNRVFPARMGGRMGWGFLDRVALPKSKRPKIYTDRQKREHTEPTGFPASLKRRVLVAPLPEDADATLALMQTVRAKGFGEVWLRIEGDGDTEHARLKSAVATGKTLSLAVGAVLPWTLKKPAGESTAVEDMTILGETGSAVWTWQEKVPLETGDTDPLPRDYREAARRELRARTADWILPDAALAARRIAPFFAVPGLCGVVLENTAPPGYTGSRFMFDSGRNATMGYTPATRLACVRATNIDPVDVAGFGYRLGSSPRLPFFPDSYSVMAPVADFRSKQNKEFMANLWEALHPAPTGTPIYLDNRNVGGYSPYPFYARWSDPKKVPTVPENAYEEAPTRTAAFKASTEPLLSSQGVPYSSATGYFWDKWYKDTRSAASGWRGFVVDLRYQSPEQIAAFLKQLPDDTALVAPAKPAGVPTKK